MQVDKTGAAGQGGRLSAYWGEAWGVVPRPPTSGSQEEAGEFLRGPQAEQ